MPPKPDPPTQTPERLHEIPTTAINIGDQMVRHDPGADDIVELAADIARRGLLQPIGVSSRPDGTYQLRFGSRRLAAHIRLNRPTILARLITHDETAVKGVALAENLQRKQMTLTEEMDAVTHLHDVDKLSPASIADLCGKDRSWVLRRLALRQLPADVGTALTEEAISIGAAEILARLEDDGARRYVLSQAVGCKLNVNQIRSLVETFEAAPSISEAITAGLETINVPTPYAQLYIACVTCTKPTKPEELALVRLCPACIATINSPEVQAALQDRPAPDATAIQRDTTQ